MPPSPPSATDIQRDTLDLARQLVACRSVTPDDGGCLDLIAGRLSAAGFHCQRLDHNGVSNLWARLGSEAPLLCLAGHVDVVPAGPLDQWTTDPFSPVERDGFLYGRGTSDMKGPVAAMVTAAERVAAAGGFRGSVALLLTSDEEGDAVDGTAYVVDRLRSLGQTIDSCIVGEPTSADTLGDTIKNGRRGSLSGELRVAGTQCHIAYPERGRNPILAALPALAELAATDWDQGNADFQPTAFQISNVHAGTGAGNIIPGTLDVAFNFRFSPESTAEQLQTRVEDILRRHGLDYALTWKPVARPFTTPRGPLVEGLVAAISETTGITPELSTSGGTSDGRFLATISSEVVEFGPPNSTMHKIDERIRVDDLGALSRIYERTIRVGLG